ncbi:MAG TPA: cytochrome c [Rhizomicrobium sp.]|jgi:mono/diheme cytochrome c family protein
MAERRDDFKGALFFGLVLLCAGGIFAYLVVALVHESPLRANDGAGPVHSGDEYVARAADCVACHSIPGGKAFAGGLKMGTPLGAFYSTNITPDPETGIGQYSLADFDRAVRQGIAKDGRHLYPAMPHPSYAKLTDADVTALYRFFMKQVPPVHQANLESDIPALLSFRWPLAIWNYFFAPSDSYVVKPGHDAAWNRGAYLVQGSGHCGACHTPRGIAIQEKALDDGNPRFLAGTELDAWYAPSLRGNMRTGLGTWSKDVVEFVKHGHNRLGTAFGSMTDAVNNSTSYLSDSDLGAIASYLKSLPATSTQQAVTYDNGTTMALRNIPTMQPGGTIYTSACASCHGFDAKGFTPYMPGLADNPVVLDHNPSSLINLMLNGSIPLVAKGMPDAYRMPQFRQQLSDEDIADVLTFIRGGWGNRAPTVTAAQVAKLRKTTDPTSDQVIILKMR